MKTLSPRNIITGMLLICYTIGSDAQSYSQRFELDVKVMTGKCNGSDEYTYQNASFPKLFSNFKNAYGLAASGIYMINDHLGSGLSAGHWSMHGWNCIDLDDYNSSSAFITSISPVAYLKSTDLLKIFTFFVQTGPSVSIVKADLRLPVFYAMNISGELKDQVLTSNDLNIGFSFSAGSVISINQTFGISIAGSWDIMKTKSILYPDKNVSILSLEAGINIKLFKDKRYYF